MRWMFLMSWFIEKDQPPPEGPPGMASAAWGGSQTQAAPTESLLRHSPNWTLAGVRGSARTLGRSSRGCSQRLVSLRPAASAGRTRNSSQDGCCSSQRPLVTNQLAWSHLPLVTELGDTVIFGCQVWIFVLTTENLDSKSGAHCIAFHYRLFARERERKSIGSKCWCGNGRDSIL